MKKEVKTFNKELIKKYIKNSELMTENKEEQINSLTGFIFWLFIGLKNGRDLNYFYDTINIWFNSVDFDDLEYARGIFENEN